ncbi:hypothetical protein MLD38_028566 [Melastoma candidum]|uniref:Uncharacterized protein n=1 Tax=Melastoma candidum TaxID=119954 RepID=A0ACB9N2Z8_9MYRT|nr:hypothetical protein MLD38_028566 [Melastoma candidum]
MMRIRTSLIPHVFLFFVSCSTVLGSAENEDRLDYIVYMGKLPDKVEVASQRYVNLLSQVLGSSSFVSERLIKTYRRSFNGFVAKLTRNEADNLKGLEGVVSVFPDRILQLHTTRSWDFLLGIKEEPRKLLVETDIIIGVLDSGIWPESESFGDAGIGPVPKKWKGACKGGANFTCNRKLIGARFYGLETDARDFVGHGTHTASTAAGLPVKNASFYGIAAGTARGGVPAARIAAYKPCGGSGCESSDILSAFDDAIADGVDIITASLGSENPPPIEEDVLAIGSFHALAKGILMTQSAGNSGPIWQTTSSTAPWILSVGASTFDRKIITKVLAGTKTVVVGRSANGFDPTGYVPIVYGKDAGDGTCDEAALKSCEVSCVVREKVLGKILVCDDEQSGPDTAINTGAAGLVTPLSRPDVAFVSPIPSTSLADAEYNNFVSYLSKTRAPKGNILKSEAIYDPTAPLVASFSSTGPNYNIADIMKPDVTAPGVDILAAFSLQASPSGLAGDPRSVAYNFLSGTSMACPHVAGIAAYVKSFHPTWSPSIIKSAIMTTARPFHQNGTNEFSYGSGLVDPIKALFPGLVYEIPYDDYVKLLCTVGINAAIIAGGNVSCSKLPKLNARDLNYPSVALSVNVSQPFSFKVTRTVLNVGPSHSIYKATIVAHPRVKVEVVPRILHFETSGQKKSFSVSVSVPALNQNEVLSSSLIWSDGTHVVRSPIVAFAP